jgi:hypothetical protein
MTIVEEQKETAKDKMSIVQKSNCPLYNRQNDFIKDKGKEKIKDNKENEKQPEAGSIDNPIPVKKEWLAERYNNLTQLANDIYMYGSKFYKMEVLPQ